MKFPWFKPQGQDGWRRIFLILPVFDVRDGQLEIQWLRPAWGKWIGYDQYLVSVDRDPWVPLVEGSKFRPGDPVVRTEEYGNVGLISYVDRCDGAGTFYIRSGSAGRSERAYRLATRRDFIRQWWLQTVLRKRLY